MSSQNPTPEHESGLLYELFEEALALQSGGGSYETVLAKCPPERQSELQQQLDFATHIQSVAPAMARPRNQTQRAAKRAAFMHEVRAASGAGGMQSIATKSFLDEIVEMLQQLAERVSQSLPQFSPGFAPIVAIFALLLMGTIGIGTAAARALPGDAVYSVKEFVRDTRESLATGSEKEQIITENEDARREENEQAAIKRQKPITVTQELRFYQKGDSIWDIGGQTVLPGYFLDSEGQPINVVPMELEGDPQPGDRVELTYMIMPGKPNLVYGVRLEVLPEITTVEPTPSVNSPAPTEVLVATPTQELVICEPSPPANWISYRVRRNDTLSALAVNTGTSVQTIKQVNCRTSDVIMIGASIYLPAVSGVTIDTNNPSNYSPTATLVPPLVASPTPTVEAIATIDGEATAVENGDDQATEVSATLTSVPETEESSKSTPEPTTDESTDATPIVDETIVATATPEFVATMTPDKTAIANETLVAEETAFNEPTATVDETPVESLPTETIVPADTVEPTVEVGATATDLPAATFTAEPTIDSTAVPEQATIVPVEPTLQAGGENETQPTADASADTVVVAEENAATPVAIEAVLPTAAPPIAPPTSPAVSNNDSASSDTSQSEAHSTISEGSNADSGAQTP